MGSAEDVALLERWRNGDRAAGSQIVKRFHLAVHGFFKNAVGDEERLDLVQDTFARLTIAKDGFRGEAGVRTYILSIARRVLIDHLRKRYRGNVSFDPLTHTVEDVQGATPSHIVMELQRSHQLLTCVRALPVDTKQMLELYYWQGVTAEDLGKIFAEPAHAPIPAGTIRRRIHEARTKLVACLATGAGVDPEREPAELEDRLRELGKLLAMGPLEA